MDRCYDIARKLGKTEEVKTYPSTAKRLRSAGRKAYWDSHNKLVVSGKDKQLSYTCTSWAIIGGLIDAQESRQAIRNIMTAKHVITPGTPYANHFFVEAMLQCGMDAEARKYVEDYWGGMVRLGADTFWEYYVPDNHMFSSYNGYTLLNSYCHAWSCTPIYFIVNYPKIFQE